jgi:putative ATPase
VKQQNLPDSLSGKRYYSPSDQGFEYEVARRLKGWLETEGEQEKEGDSKI